MKAIEFKNFLNNFTDEELRRMTISVHTTRKKPNVETNFIECDLVGMSYSDPTKRNPLGAIYLYGK
ncbi:MAG: hypothetical protein IT569_00575 [Leptospiraceae bacterium]|nr:hypothetical protein [Leptospiraceae bacterium]